MSGPDREQAGAPTPDRERERLVLEHMSLVHALARRYARRGEPLEDLVQVGMEGLIKAIDRFDPARGASLVSFATPTILGEIRRHFRDRVRVLRVPRGVQEAQALVRRATDDLTAERGRSPTVREIGARAGLGDEEVLDALAAAAAFRPLSLSPASDDESAVDVGDVDPGFALVEGRAGLQEALRQLPARQRVILELRMVQGLTQAQIAERVGVSQMHVSRLLRRSLSELRRTLGVPEEDTP